MVQDAFERVIRSLHGFDASQPFAPWLRRIVVNRAIDVLRRDRREAFSLGEDVPDARRGDVGSETALIAGLAELGAERRAVVVMRYVMGYSPPEIAELLELSVGTVHSRLARGLGELRAILGEP